MGCAVLCANQVRPLCQVFCHPAHGHREVSLQAGPVAQLPAEGPCLRRLRRIDQGLD
jgi:hypothetical protein